jgi:hypothetical protein
MPATTPTLLKRVFYKLKKNYSIYLSALKNDDDGVYGDDDSPPHPGDREE